MLMTLAAHYQLRIFERNSHQARRLYQTVTSLTSQVAKLKTLQWELPTEFLSVPTQVEMVQGKLKSLDALPSLLNKVTDALNQIKKVKKYDFVTEGGKRIHLTEEQINQQKKIEEDSKAKAAKRKSKARKEELVDLLGLEVVNNEWREVMNACLNKTGKGWKIIYRHIQKKMDYIHEIKAELGINLDIPLSEQDPLNKPNDLVNKKRKLADDIHDYFKANKRLKLSVQYEDHPAGTILNEPVLGKRLLYVKNNKAISLEMTTSKVGIEVQQLFIKGLYLVLQSTSALNGISVTYWMHDTQFKFEGDNTSTIIQPPCYSAGKKVVKDLGEDEDFMSGSWVNAIDYVNVDGDISCSPNVIGDLTVTMKDLSGTIPGKIHHKVINEGGYRKNITVRAALILANVSVFSSKPSMHYLSIPMRNVFKANPRESHLIVVKRIFRYLKEAPNLGLWYPKGLGFEQKAYSESDYAGCNLDRKSTSAEAEYVVIAGCCAQVLLIKSQLAYYDVLYDKVPIFCNNTSSIAISNNPVLHSRTKHINIGYHFIRDHILKGDIELHFVPTDLQLNDIFTKLLAEPGFTRLVAELGMLNIEKRFYNEINHLHLSHFDKPLSFDLDVFSIIIMLKHSDNFVSLPPKETVRVGLATLGLIDENHPSISSTNLVNSSYDQLNVNQETIMYCLCWGLNIDKADILFSNLLVQLHLVTGKPERKSNIYYTRCLSLIMEHLLKDAYINENLKTLKPHHITTLSFKPTLENEVALTAHM
ncbi:retrovirus-related pol polyprotein from transposon TNT 1-94 [Tanacetum coccineum]